MKCVFKGENIAVLNKAIRCFAKVSDEVFVQTFDHGLRFQATTHSKSAYVELNLNRNFFLEYDNPEDISIKMNISSLWVVFHCHSLDREAFKCTILIENDMPKVGINMICQYGVTRKFQLPYMEAGVLNFADSTAKQMPSMRVRSRILSTWFRYLPKTLTEITIFAYPNRMKIKNFIDTEMTDTTERANVTQFNCMPRECERYDVKEPISATFDISDVKKFLLFTSYGDMNVDLKLSNGGRPISFNVESSIFNSKMLVAPLDIPFPVDSSPPHDIDSYQSSYSSQVPHHHNHSQTSRTNNQQDHQSGQSNMYNEHDDEQQGNPQYEQEHQVHTQDYTQDEDNVSCSLSSNHASSGQSEIAVESSSHNRSGIDKYCAFASQSLDEGLDDEDDSNDQYSQLKGMLPDFYRYESSDPFNDPQDNESQPYPSLTYNRSLPEEILVPDSDED